MPLVKTKRGIERQALQAIHHPPSATQTVKVSKENQDEKRKMVKELIPFLAYLYKKYMGATISERVVESYLESRTNTHLTKLTEVKKKSSNQPEYKEVDPTLASPRGFESPMDVEDELTEDINIPLNVGDTVLGGKFKNKRIVVKSIGKNEKGEITINGKPLLKYRLVSEANAVSGGKVNKYITGKNLTLKGKKYSDIEFEVLSIDNKSQLVKLKVLAPKDIFGQEMNVPFKTIRRGPFLKTNTSINEIPMADLQKIDQFADKQLNPIDVVITDKHFFDRLNDPRNGKEISQAELIGFFKRLGKNKKKFVEFLDKYEQMVAVDDRTNINIPFMKQANKAIAKTIMRKKDFKSTTPKLDI